MKFLLWGALNFAAGTYIQLYKYKITWWIRTHTRRGPETLFTLPRGHGYDPGDTIIFIGDDYKGTFEVLKVDAYSATCKEFKWLRRPL